LFFSEILISTTGVFSSSNWPATGVSRPSSQCTIQSSPTLPNKYILQVNMMDFDLQNTNSDCTRDNSLVINGKYFSYLITKNIPSSKRTTLSLK